MNYIEDDLDKKAFGITYLKIVVDNLNITDLQQKNTKVEATVKTLNRQMQQKFYFWGVLGKKWLSLIQSNEDVIKDLKSKPENFISPNINDSFQPIDVILNQRVTTKTPGNIQFPYMIAQNLALIDTLEKCIESLETQQ